MEDFRCRDDLRMNDIISIELPAHVWLAFVAGYDAIEDVLQPANVIREKVINAIVHPVVLNEMEAQRQQYHDAQEHLSKQMFRAFGNPTGDDDPRLEADPFD